MENNIQQPPKKTKILNYINVFRGLAILLIIMGHTMQFGDANSLAHIINCEIICGGTALFIFISGFLFQHLSPKFEYKNYLSKKWTNVIMPYLIISIPGIILCFMYPEAYKNSFAGLSAWLQIPLHITIGRVHNIPTWFIPMIVIFFIFSWCFLKLEKKGILYKLLPILFLITMFFPRGIAEYENTIGLEYIDKYFVYLKYIFTNFVHFLSLYVFGMYCSAHKEIIDKFYDKRFWLWLFMLGFSLFDIYLQYKYQYSNYTISKTFLTMLILAYLKHYDEFILSHKKTNKTLDFIAKYSFGLFFVHWYWFFAYNQLFNLPTVAPLVNNNYLLTFGIILARFFAVALISLVSLFLIKILLLKINPEINTRKFIGI
ncbi:acyltransferase [bacterium]|nr:acyltransferase [bacterium]